MMIDEIGLLLNKRILTKVSTLAQISEILKKTEQSKRVLEEASEGFALDVVREDETGDETISIDRLTTEGDSPIIRGFVARGDIFRDSFRDPGWYTRDLFDVDRVEVYKGPSSFAFGRGCHRYRPCLRGPVAVIPVSPVLLNGPMPGQLGHFLFSK